MAQYGEILDKDFRPELNEMYEAFTKYFNNPTMSKIKNVDNYSMYISKLYCLLSNECRYLIVLVPIDNKGLKSLISLSDINWISFQTRTLHENYELPPHSYIAKRGGLLDCEILRIKVTEKASTYSCEKFPIIINILHSHQNTQKDNYSSSGSDSFVSEYQDKGVIITALETFQTIISLK